MGSGSGFARIKRASRVIVPAKPAPRSTPHSALRAPHFSPLAFLLAALLAGQALAQSDAPGFLGVAISEPAKMDDASAQQFFSEGSAEEFLKAWRLRAEDRGALVLSALPGYAADQFGIIPGDLIVAANGAEVASPDKFLRLIGAMRPGTEVQLALLRAGREKKIAARLGPRPAEYPLWLGAMPEAEPPKAAPPPDGMPPLVTPEEAAKALGDDFAPETAATDPDYDAAVKLYQESRVARAEGLLLAGPITLGADDAAVARAGDEVVKLGGKPVATPMGFVFEILKHKRARDFPLTLDVRAEGAEEPARTIRIESARDADRVLDAAFFIFSDEERVLLWLLDLFPADSAKNLEGQKGLSEQFRDSLQFPDAASFPFPAVVLTAPVMFHYDSLAPAGAQLPGDQQLQGLAGDIVMLTVWPHFNYSPRREASLLIIHDGRRRLVEGSNWNPSIADLVAEGRYLHCDWCELARLQPRQLLECVVAARALRLTKLAEDAAAFLREAYPESKEAAALKAHDRPIELAAGHARLRDSAAAGDIRLAVEAAQSLLGTDSQGRYSREAKQFMDCVHAAASVRLARAEKLLDAGDIAGARRETAPVARAVPEDARLASLLGRCDDLDTVQSGRRALDDGQLRRARLMAEAALARNPGGAEANPARQLLDDVRSAAKSRTDRANRLLDAGDAASAQEELAPVLQAFPDDPAAVAAWNRSRPPAKIIEPQK